MPPRDALRAAPRLKDAAPPNDNPTADQDAELRPMVSATPDSGPAVELCSAGIGVPAMTRPGMPPQHVVEAAFDAARTNPNRSERETLAIVARVTGVSRETVRMARFAATWPDLAEQMRGGGTSVRALYREAKRREGSEPDRRVSVPGNDVVRAVEILVEHYGLGSMRDALTEATCMLASIVTDTATGVRS